ncbi:MAG: hypothetical protein ACRD2I_08690 [Vicinamibacterales bacterium]
MIHRASGARGLMAAAVAAAVVGIGAQRPAVSDLEGIWNYATMTPLERPRNLAAVATLTPEQAADYNERSMIGMLRGARAQEKF